MDFELRLAAQDALTDIRHRNGILIAIRVYLVYNITKRSSQCRSERVRGKPPTFKGRQRKNPCDVRICALEDGWTAIFAACQLSDSDQHCLIEEVRLP